MTETIIISRDGAIATVVLNRPKKLNALTRDMWSYLGEAMTDLSVDDEIRCVVLRGAGGKAFAPGNDISEFETERFDPVSAKAYGVVMHRTLAVLRDCRHPTVALIEGICVGGGLEIASLCDIRICGTSSRFGVPVNRLGLVMAHAELDGLLRLVGPAIASEIVLEGRVFDAVEAKDKGLVTRVVADNEVEDEAYAAAHRIADGAPLVARWHKQFIRRIADPRPLTEAETDEGFACFGTDDFATGYRAFLAKTKPEFNGS